MICSNNNNSEGWQQWCSLPNKPLQPSPSTKCTISTNICWLFSPLAWLAKISTMSECYFKKIIYLIWIILFCFVYFILLLITNIINNYKVFFFHMWAYYFKKNLLHFSLISAAALIFSHLNSCGAYSRAALIFHACQGAAVNRGRRLLEKIRYTLISFVKFLVIYKPFAIFTIELSKFILLWLFRLHFSWQRSSSVTILRSKVRIIFVLRFIISDLKIVIVGLEKVYFFRYFATCNCKHTADTIISIRHYCIILCQLIIRSEERMLYRNNTNENQTRLPSLAII